MPKLPKTTPKVSKITESPKSDIEINDRPLSSAKNATDMFELWSGVNWFSDARSGSK